MKAVDPATAAALQGAQESGLRLRDLATFRVRSFDGATTATFPFWSDIDTVTIQVVRGDTGAAEYRNFVGDGALLKVGQIILSSDLAIQTVTVTLSQVHATVQNMIRGYDCHQAQVEIHRVLFNPATNAVIGAAQCHFIGKVNKAPVTTPRSGEEGGIDLDCVAHIREMTRTNPAKKSDEAQKRRSDDRFRRHIGVANVKIFWGSEKEKAAGSDSSNGGSGESTDFPVFALGRR